MRYMVVSRRPDTVRAESERGEKRSTWYTLIIPATFPSYPLPTVPTVLVALHKQSQCCKQKYHQRSYDGHKHCSLSQGIFVNKVLTWPTLSICDPACFGIGAVEVEPHTRSVTRWVGPCRLGGIDDVMKEICILRCSARYGKRRVGFATGFGFGERNTFIRYLPYKWLICGATGYAMAKVAIFGSPATRSARYRSIHQSTSGLALCSIHRSGHSRPEWRSWVACLLPKCQIVDCTECTFRDKF